MSEYLDIRREAIKIIDSLTAIHAEYKQIANAGGPALQTRLIEHVKTHELELREGVMELGNDPRYQTVLAAEAPLLRKVNIVAAFWMFLQQNGVVEGPDQRDPLEAKTKLPPQPAEEITGANVLAYMKDLTDWILYAADELWEEESPIEMPRLGDRFLIGDFGQTTLIADILGEGLGLRHHWIQLAACGAYWDTVNVGAARAKLIYKGEQLIQTLLHPPG